MSVGCGSGWMYLAMVLCRCKKGALVEMFCVHQQASLAASELVHYMYIEENALLSELEMLGVGFEG